MAALALGADGINMGSRFMCTVESCIHQNVKEAIVAGDERGTELIFRSLHNTARVASNVVSREVVEILKGGGQFEDVKDLVAGVRGRKVFDDGDIDAGIWTVGTAMGLINDIPTVGDLVSRIVSRGRGPDHRTDWPAWCSSRKRNRPPECLSTEECPHVQAGICHWLQRPRGAALTRRSGVTGERRHRRSDVGAPDRSAGDRMPVFELLRGVTLNEEVAVVERFEINFDDICTGVVDPHETDCMGHY